MKIHLVTPKNPPSFWTYDRILPALGKRCIFPNLSMPTVAGLTPSGHEVTLCDENVEEIDFDVDADIVGVTGYIVHRERMFRIIEEFQRRGRFVVVGGPFASLCPEELRGRCDVLFVDEAEQTWPQFLGEWSQGLHQCRYEQLEKSDMTKVPTPRFDLLKMKRYAYGSLQFSRGCPFQCEFCDIIVTFGRRPRIKTAAQVIAELEAMQKTGLRIAFVVDDNLIGNKKAIKQILREVIGWQQRHGYPMTLFTEASIDLADDQELLDLMVEANFIATFIGIESPSEDALRETKKFQNVRQGGTLLEKMHRIQEAGMEVWCGMIMGFDSDDSGIFDRQIEFIQNSRISFSMSGMLSAIPKTPLHDRLASEGRLDLADRPEFGTNVIPLQIGREELLEGYLRVLKELYDPEAFFARTDALFLDPSFEIGIASKRRWWRISPRWLRSEIQSAIEGLGLFARLMSHVPDRALRKQYRKRVWGFLKVHRRPGLLLFYVFHLAMHYHVSKLANDMSTRESQLVNSY